MEMIDTNIKGLFLVTRAFLPAMVKENKGHVVNLGSTAGLYAYAGAAVYCATKAAVKTFSDGLRIDVMASDVKITTIQPGLVETPFSEVRFHGDTKRAASVYAGIDALQAEDIADVIAFVVSRPKRVQISDVVIMAAQQGTGFLVSKKQRLVTGDSISVFTKKNPHFFRSEDFPFSFIHSSGISGKRAG